MSLYLILNLLTVSFPLVRSFEPRVKYYSKWKALFLAMTISATIFIVWDEIFTRNGIWGFNPDYLIGIYLFQLPVEEWLFFFTIPFASLFIYENVVYFIKKPMADTAACKLLLGLAILLITLAIANLDRAYTFYNFLGSALLFFYLSLVAKPTYLGHFLVAYLFILIPFFIVNGILTGSFIDAPVVWYNDAENLGFRVGTIPIEDTIYGLFLLLLNVHLYEVFKKKGVKS